MKIRKYRVFQDCLESGVQAGYTRAHKHTDTPSEQVIVDSIVLAVKENIDEYFIFEDDDDGY